MNNSIEIFFAGFCTLLFGSFPIAPTPHATAELLNRLALYRSRSTSQAMSEDLARIATDINTAIQRVEDERAKS